MKLICTKCSVKQPIENFSVNRRAKSGRHSACKACDKAWREANREGTSAYGRAYRIKHGDRLRARAHARRQTLAGRSRKAFDKSVEKARKHGRTTTMQQSEVLALFTAKKSCAYCGVAVGMGEGKNIPTMDHVYSMCHDLGGENIVKNITVACLPCNLLKGNLHVYDFYRKSDLFTEELWRAFISDFISRLIERPITDAEVDTMAERLATESGTKT